MNCLFFFYQNDRLQLAEEVHDLRRTEQFLGEMLSRQLHIVEGSYLPASSFPSEVKKGSALGNS